MHVDGDCYENNSKINHKLAFGSAKKWVQEKNAEEIKFLELHNKRWCTQVQ